MNIDGIKAAQIRTYLDLAGGRKWSPDRLGEPHLPHTVKQFARGNETDLETPAVADVVIPKRTLMETPMMSLQMASGEFSRTHFTADGLYVEDMPIKVPGGKITMPHNVYIGPFTRILNDIIVFEYEHNPHVFEQYFYLTVQQSRVKAGTAQRQPGLHLDGFQKPSIIPQIAQHQLAVCNAVPTEFVAHSYDASVFPADKNIHY